MLKFGCSCYTEEQFLMFHWSFLPYYLNKFMNLWLSVHSLYSSILCLHFRCSLRNTGLRLYFSSFTQALFHTQFPFINTQDPSDFVIKFWFIVLSSKNFFVLFLFYGIYLDCLYSSVFGQSFCNLYCVGEGIFSIWEFLSIIHILILTLLACCIGLLHSYLVFCPLDLF